MQDDEFKSLFTDSEPYLADDGFTAALMARLPTKDAKPQLWINRLPALAVLMALAIVAWVMPIAQPFQAFILQPLHWQQWWHLGLMMACMLGVSIVWVSEEGWLKNMS